MVAFDTPDGGGGIYRNAGFELPSDRIALLSPRDVLYNEHDGALYYASGTTIAVGTAGSVVLVAAPSLPGLAALITGGFALPVETRVPIGGFRVFRLIPGASVLGVTVVATAGPRPLGTGI